MGNSRRRAFNAEHEIVLEALNLLVTKAGYYSSKAIEDAVMRYIGGTPAWISLAGVGNTVRFRLGLKNTQVTRDAYYLTPRMIKDVTHAVSEGLAHEDNFYRVHAHIIRV